MKTLTLIFLIGLTAFSFAGDEDNEVVKGKVKELKVHVHKAALDSVSGKVVKGELTGGYKKIVYIKFNKRGNITERYYDYDWDKGTYYLAYYNYYVKKKLVDSACSYIRDDQVPSSWRLYKYDKKKRLIEKRNIEDDGRERSRDEYFYNEKGQLVKHKTYYWTKPDHSYIYTYDANGNRVTEKNIFHKLKDAVNRSEFQYDANGNLIKEFKWDSKEKLVVENEYRYNEQNLKVYECRKDDGICRYTYEWKYDDKSNVIEKKSIEPVYGEDESRTYTHTMKYVYDKKGNWVQKTTFYNREPKEIVERVIIYK